MSWFLSQTKLSINCHLIWFSKINECAWSQKGEGRVCKSKLHFYWLIHNDNCIYACDMHRHRVDWKMIIILRLPSENGTREFPTGIFRKIGDFYFHFSREIYPGITKNIFNISNIVYISCNKLTTYRYSLRYCWSKVFSNKRCNVDTQRKIQFF